MLIRRLHSAASPTGRRQARLVLVHMVRPALGRLDMPARLLARQDILEHGFNFRRAGESRRYGGYRPEEMAKEPQGLYTVVDEDQGAGLDAIGEPVVFLDVSNARLLAWPAGMDWRSRMTERERGAVGSRLTQRLRKQGWDGIQLVGTSEVVVFRPNEWPRAGTFAELGMAAL